jgi:hypothetical protein
MKKSELLNWLQEEYRQWEAFLDQIGPTHMEQPGVTGQQKCRPLIGCTTQRTRTVPHWLAHHIVQLGGQRFSASEFFDHFHDDHEPDMRAWLARVEKQ